MSTCTCSLFVSRVLHRVVNNVKECNELLLNQYVDYRVVMLLGVLTHKAVVGGVLLVISSAQWR